jgi:uncharacterized iron-regulated membrane protein
MPRLLLRRIHLVVSLVAGLWLAASGLAGSLLVFGDALDRRMHPALFEVNGSSLAPIDNVIAAAEKASGGRATRVRLAGSATSVHEVWIDCDDCRRVWVDPSTAQVNGIRTAHGTTRTFLHELHRRMFFRGAGDVGAAVGGLGLVLLSITGITLGWRGGFRPRLGNFRRTNYELHRVGGLIASPLLLVAACTGIYFIQAGLRASKAADASPVRTTVQPLVDRAKREFPSSEATWVTLPGRELVVRFRQPEEKHPNGRTFVRLDPRTGEVVGVTDALAAPASKKFFDNLYPLHIGATGGIVHRLMLVVAGAMPAFLFCSGLLIWWKRSSGAREASRRAGRARVSAGDPSDGAVAAATFRRER